MKHVLRFIGFAVLIGGAFGLTFFMQMNEDLSPDDSNASYNVIYYLDCNNGSNANTGTSVDSAWKDLTRVNGATLQAGESLLLKKGCTWTGQINANWQGTKIEPIIVSTYGEGNNPLIQANPNGVKRTAAAGVNITGSYITVENLRITLINPYRETRCVDQFGNNTGLGWYRGIDVSGNNNIIRNNEIFGPLSAGVSLNDNAKYNKVLNNYIHDLTSLWQLWRDSTDQSQKDDYFRTVPIGQTIFHSGGPIGAVGINLHGDNGEYANNLFENNRAECLASIDSKTRIYSAPFEVFHANKNFVHHNKAFGHKKHFEMGRWNPDPNNTKTTDDNVLAYNLFVSDVESAKGPNIHGNDDFGPVNRTKIYNNTIVFTGPNSEAIVASGPNTEVKNNILIADGRRKNNIVTEVNEYKIAYSCNGTSIFSNNIFGRAGGGAKIQLGETLQNCPNRAVVNESNSRIVDPLISELFENYDSIEISNSDFNIKDTSHAKDNGLNEVLDITLNNILISTDLNNGRIPYEENVDIGAIEFGAIAETDPTPTLNITASPTPRKNGGGGGNIKVTPTIILEPSTECISAFVDVDCENKFRDYIYKLKTESIISGFSDNTYKPMLYVTRGEIATFIVKAFNLSSTGNINVRNFKDSIEGPHKQNIIILSNLDVVQGFSDGTFKKDVYVNREQVSKFIYNALNAKGVNVSEINTNFSDVLNNNEFKGYIGYVESKGIVSGFSDGTFRPKDYLTREQMAKIIWLGRSI